MKSTLDRFISEIKQLENYIGFINSINGLIKYKPLDTDSQKIKDAVANTKLSLDNVRFKKVFEYNSIIVSMYGYFEKFIEDLMVDYLELLSKYIPDYRKLPDSIKENHLLLTAQLIQNLKLPKYDKENISVITEKLNNCIIKDKSDLNTIAFTDHSSNFRIDSISDFFSKIGVKGLSSRIKNKPSFNDFLKDRLGNHVDLSQTKNELIFSILDDLAQRRNDISHGSNRSNSILNSSVFPEYFEFLIQFSTSLYEILNETLLEHECNLNYKKVPLVAIYNSVILCVEIGDAQIKKGDRIIVKQGKIGSKNYKERKIEEIQINNVPKDSIEIDKQSIKVAFKLDLPVKENQEFFIRQKYSA